MGNGRIEGLKLVAGGIAAQFGSDCEVAVHDLEQAPDHSLVYIINGHVSGRKAGDGVSHVVLEQMKSYTQEPRDHITYVIKTPGGKILKSSAIYLRNSGEIVSAILEISYDISKLLMVEGAIHGLVSTEGPHLAGPEKIISVHALLEDLIQQSVELVGKPVALMNKDDKIRAIQFLNQNGAFLITKSGDKVAKYFGISKYTLYSYIDYAKPHPEK